MKTFFAAAKGREDSKRNFAKIRGGEEERPMGTEGRKRGNHNGWSMPRGKSRTVRGELKP